MSVKPERAPGVRHPAGPPAPEPPTLPGERGRRSWLAVLGPFIGLVLVIVLFAMMSGSPERYLSANNLRVVLAQTVIVALGAIGMTLIIVSGGIDLSVGSAIALSSVITAIGLRDGWAPVPACAAAAWPRAAWSAASMPWRSRVCASCRSSPPSACWASPAAWPNGWPTSRP